MSNRNLVLLTALSFLPVLAFAEDASNSSSLPAVRLIWVLIYLAGAIKCFTMIKRETTSTLCVLSLALTLIGVAVASGGVQMKGVHAGIFYIGLGLGSFLILAGFILSIVGLSLYSSNKEHVQGKKQAITAMVISLLFISFFAYGVISRLTSSNIKGTVLPSKSSYVFEELNFKFSPYDKKYVNLAADTISEDATLVLRNTSKFYFMVIAEDPGSDIFDLQSLENVVKANAGSGATKVGDWSRQEKVVNGYQGLMLSIDMQASGIDFSYVYWIYEHNGYIYQLIAWSSFKHKTELQKEFLALLDGFELISIDRVVNHSAAALGNHDSVFGYEAKFLNSQWIAWSDLNENYLAADFGGAVGDFAYFHVTPYCHGLDKPHESAIKSALLKAMNITYSSENLTTIGSVTLGDMTGEIMSYHWDDDGTRMEARLTSLIGDQCSFLISMWTSLGAEKTTQYMEDIHSKISFGKSVSIPESEEYVKAHATLNNYVGMHYYDIDNYAEALRYFKLAIQADSGYRNYLTNGLDSLNRLKHYDEGLSYYNEYSGALHDDPEVLSWKAWFENALGKNEDAIVTYEKVFSQGYRSDNDLKNYLDKLVEMKLFAQADKALVDYAEEPNSFDFLRKRASIKSAMGLGIEALEILDKAQEGKPFNYDIAFDKIDVHDTLGQYNKILEITQNLIDQGHLTTGTYFYKGKAEYNLAWYIQAKASLESALERSPNNDTIKSYLDQVSSRLGQGDSTSIAFSIDPVALPDVPSTTQVDVDMENSYDSFYLRRAQAFYYVKGERVRKTYYRTVKVLNAAGVERFSSMQTDFDPTYENAYVNSVIVKDENGKVVSEGRRSDFYVLDKESELADTDKTIHIPVSGLLPNYTIELVTTTETLGPVHDFSFERIYLTSSRPTRQSMLYVEGDIDELKFIGQSVSSPQKTSSSLLWLEHYPTPYYWEPMESDYSTELASVFISGESKSWKELGGDYLLSIKDRLGSTQELAKISANITAGLKSDAEKIQALSHFVQDKITYKALEFGVRGLIPNSAAETLGNNFGDCKDHAVLLQRLLLLEGMDAKLALVSTSDRVNSTLPSLNQFNHMVVALKRKGKYVYYDTTDKNLVMNGQAPVGLGGRKALILDSRKSVIKDIPEYHGAGQDLNISRSIELKNSGEAHVREEVRLSSYVASWWRKHLKKVEPSKQYDWAQGFISEHRNDIKVERVKISNLYERNQPLLVEMDYVVPRSKSKTAGVWEYTDYTPWESHFMNTESVHDRKKSFEVFYPFTLRTEVNISVESGLKLRRPKDRKDKQKGKFGSFKKVWSKDGPILKKEYFMNEISKKYAADEYQSYVKFMRQGLESIGDTVEVEVN